MPSFGEFLWGKKNKLKQKPTYTPEQQQFLNQIIGNLSNMDENGFNQAMDYYKQLLQPGSEAEQAYTAPIMREFEEQTLPGIAERFAGAGALSSSGFGQALSSAGAGLQERLAQLRAGLQQQAAQAITGNYYQQGGMALQAQPYAYVEKPGGVGMVQSGYNAFLHGLGGSANPAGSMGR